MPTRTLKEKAAARGVSLEQLAEVLQPLASAHFGPRVRVELRVEAERLQLFSAFRVEAKADVAALAIETVKSHLGADVEIGDELVFQLFFSPDEEEEAAAQDHQYDALIGLSSICCGFWPVARRALAPLLDLSDDPLEEAVERALFLSVATPAQRAGKFALRRGTSGALFLKEEIAVGNGEIAAGHFGRRDLVDGVYVEIIRREVPVAEVITGLFGSDALSLACEGEGSDVTSAQLVAAFAQRDVHLARRTAFRTRVDRLVGDGKPGLLSRFAQLVGSERDARFIP